jgi:xanthine dehydrogenase accessory factor
MQQDPELVDAATRIPQMLLVGLEPFGAELARQAALLGWSATTTADLDASIAALEPLGAGDSVIVLEHQHQIATPVLAAALQAEVGYVGALGSRRMQASRVKFLRSAGVTDNQLDALHCPTGLDLGARTPAESAVSIVAEIIAARSGRDAQPLRTGTNRISA